MVSSSYIKRVQVILTDEPQPIRRLARLLDVESSNLKPVLDEMAAMGLVEQVRLQPGIYHRHGGKGGKNPSRGWRAIVPTDGAAHEAKELDE